MIHAIVEESIPNPSALIAMSKRITPLTVTCENDGVSRFILAAIDFSHNIFALIWYIVFI
jgi:hypothetical protein